MATICTGLFGQRKVAAYGGVEIEGGVFFDGNIKQLWIQVVEALIGLLWSGVGSFIIIALIDCVPGMEVLATDKQIAAGLDTNETEETLHECVHPSEQDYMPIDGSSLGLE